MLLCLCLFSVGLLAQQTERNPFTEGQAFVPKNNLDELFLQSLRSHNIEPAPICSDEVFLRRIYLDVLGTLPTMQEVRNFLEDTNANKRVALIDDILDREEFVDLQTMRWCDLLRVKAEFPINLWPNGAACYYRWIRRSIEENKTYDQFVRELITANGSNFRDGASNFYRAVPANDADTLAEAVYRTFLGIDLTPLSAEQRKRASIFFSRVGYKETAQWKEEIVFWNRTPLDEETIFFLDGTTANIDPNRDPRQIFADWLISSTNAEFNRTAVNRIWGWLFGSGLLPEPEASNAGEPPLHPELLDALCSELVKAEYDLKHIYRLILNSGIYQQCSIPNVPESAALFAAYPIRRIEAEVFQDVLAQIFDLPIGYVSEVPEPFTHIPPRHRTIALPDSSITSPFLETFGRASRDTGTEADRNNGVTESQLLFLLNSTEVNNWIGRFISSRTLARRLGNDSKGVVDEIWLTFLSRYPMESEYRIAFAELGQRNKPAGQRIQDLIWGLLNTAEFLCKH